MDEALLVVLLFDAERVEEAFDAALFDEDRVEPCWLVWLTSALTLVSGDDALCESLLAWLFD